MSRQYRQLPSADVPTELDRLVLRQAQEAVKAKPAKSRTWMRWTGPLALAASAILVVSIVIESGVHEDTYLTVPASAPAEVTMQQKEAIEQPTAGSAAEKRAPQADEAQDKALADSANDASVIHVAPVEPPSPQMVQPVRPPAMAPEAPAPARNRAFAIAPVVPRPAPAPAPQLETAPPPEEVTVQAQKLEQHGALNSASVSMTVTSDMHSELEEAVVTGMRRRESKQTAGPRNTIAAPSASYSQRDADEEQADEPRDYSDPEQWLSDIRELRKEKKHDEANREWRRFRYVFPNYEVAEDDPARGRSQ